VGGHSTIPHPLPSRAVVQNKVIGFLADLHQKHTFSNYFNYIICRLDSSLVVGKFNAAFLPFHYFVQHGFGVNGGGRKFNGRQSNTHLQLLADGILINIFS